MAILTKIRSSNIADSAITTTKIAVDAVTAGKIVAGAVAADVGTGGITTTLIAADAVTTEKIVDSVVTTFSCVKSTSITVTHASHTFIVGTAVSGVGIPAGATIATIVSATSFTLSAAATDSLTSTLTFNTGITSDKLAENLILSGSVVSVPVVTTANLPGTAEGTNASLTAVDGMLVYNSSLGILQQRAAGVWAGIANVIPTISSFQYSDGAAATAEKTLAVTLSCTTVSSSTTVTATSTTGMIVGQVVSGVGIALGSTVISINANVSFVLSLAATAPGTVTLTFGGVITITGTNFDSILGGSVGNASVTFGGVAATATSVNNIKTIITCTPPAHAAGTVILKITNGDGQSAETNFIYDEEAIFTTAAGSLGGFVEGTVYADNNAASPRIQATDGEGSPTALTTGFQRVTSASDDTVITTSIGDLVLQTTGYLTGTLVAAANATTYPFYATAKDTQNQRTAPRLFNIISYDYPASGGLIIEPAAYSGSFVSHTFFSSGNGQPINNFTVISAMNVDYLVVAGGGGGAGGVYSGAGGAGGFLTAAGHSVTAQTYAIVVGAGGAGGDGQYSAGNYSIQGGLSSFDSIVSTGGGRGAYFHTDTIGGPGGSGGGAGYNGTVYAGGTSTASPNQGNDGGTGGNLDHGYSGGGGGGAGSSGASGAQAGTDASRGGAGLANYYRDGNTSGTTAGFHVFAGGGGGAWQGAGGGIGGKVGSTVLGGDGGGGTSASDAGTSGVADTGSGGGGGGVVGTGGSAYQRGGNGGTGIVVIRYAV